MATSTVFPFRIGPINNIQPFTYRDGMSHLQLLEKLRVYININLRGEFNDELNRIITEFNDGMELQEGQFNTAFADFVIEINDAVMAINNRVGPEQIQRATLTEDYLIEIDPTWPDAHPIMFQLTQDATGGHDITVTGDIVGTPFIASAPGSKSEFWLVPEPTGVWRVLQPETDYARKDDLFVNVLDHGAIGDNVTDDTVALQAAADYAFSLSPHAVLYFPAKSFKTTGTVSVRCAIDGSQGTINYHGVGTALVLGHDVSGSVTARIEFKCPRIIKIGGTSWDGTSKGIRAVNLNSCALHVPFVQNFEHGLYTLGKGQGFAYTSVHIGALWGNHKNLYLDQDDTGWNNSNSFFGGRFAQGTAWNGTTDTEAVQVYMVAPPSAQFGNPNANTFVGCSFESDGQYHYRAVIGGWHNVFLNCRWENTTGAANANPRVLYKANAALNSIISGYDAAKIEETFEGTLVGNTIRDGQRIYLKASHVTGQLIPTGVTTKMQDWSSFLAFRATHDTVLHEFKPRPGRWRIRANVSFAANETGYRQAALRSGATTLDFVRQPGDAAVIGVMKLEGTKIFNGTETFYLEVTQTSGADLALVGTANFNLIEADFLPS